MTESTDSLTLASNTRWLDRCFPFRRGVSLQWSAAWLIAVVLVLIPLTAWRISQYPPRWWIDPLETPVLAWIYFGPPLLAAVIWKSGKIFTAAILMVWVTLLLDVAWLALRIGFQDFRWP